MPKYKIFYTFEGRGETIIEAPTQEEAEDMFFDGSGVDYSKEDDTSIDIQEVEEVK